eukprot:SAG31_NODE_1181_length_9513_cov_6.219035_4_plen_64_part_00
MFSATYLNCGLLGDRLGNQTDGHRPSLVVRFDSPKTPPPGMAMFGTRAFEWLGWIAAALQTRD